MSIDVMGEPDESPTKTIYLVRHGETAMNARKVMRGWDDPKLNEEGRMDAQQVAKALKGVRLDSAFSSDLRRATETMQTIEKAQEKKPRTVVTELLRTIDVGTWTGKPLDEMEPKLLKLQDRWRTDPSAAAPGGESWAVFQGRQIKAWKQILAADGDNILVVAHLRCTVWALGYALVGQKPLAGDDLLLLGRITQSPGKFSIFSHSAREGLKILRVNAMTIE